MFATLKAMYTQHQDSCAGSSARARPATLDGLEQRRVLSVSTPVVAVIHPPPRMKG